MLRIVATPITRGQDFVIADGTGARGPGGKLHVQDIDCVFEAQVDNAAYINAEATQNIPNVSGKYNESGNMPLEVEYTFQDEGQCMAFAFDLQNSCPVLAHVVISAGGKSRTLAYAVLRPLRFKTIGEVALRVSYPIRFGMVHKTLSL